MSIRWLYPTSNVVDSTSVSAVGAAQKYQCVDDPVGDPDDADYCGVITNTSQTYHTFGFPSMPTSVNIYSVKACWRAYGSIATTGGVHGAVLRIGGTTYEGPSRLYSTGYYDFDKTWTSNPATGKVWTPDDVTAMSAGFYQATYAGGLAYVSQYYLEIEYTPVPPKYPVVRDTLSRRYWHNRRPAQLLSVDVTSDLGLDFGLLDYLPVSHIAGPHDSSTDGWAHKVWERRPTRVEEIDIDPKEDKVSLVLKDLRPFLALWKDDAWATRRGDLVADSVCRLDKGNTRTFSRPSSCWYDSPLQDYVVESEDDYEAHALNGDLTEGAATNYIKRSSFKDGTGDTFTGWTLETTSASIAKSTTGLLFSEDVSTRCMKMTASALGNVSVAGTTTDSVTANTVMRLSIDHKDATTSGIFYWSLRRHADGYYWNNTLASWGSTKHHNATTPSLEWDRHISEQINIGTSATTLAVYLGATGGVLPAGQVNYVAHVQLEDRPFATSRIVTGSTRVTRENAVLTIASSSGRRAWSNDYGAWACSVIPEWDSTDVSGEVKTICAVVHSTDDHQHLYYDGTSGMWVFEHKTGGVTSRATLSHAPDRGTAYDVVARWTGANGELDKDPYTVSLFVAGSCGTDATATGVCAEAASAPLEIGSKTTANFFDGQIRLRHAYAFVPTDEECKRLP